MSTLAFVEIDVSYNLQLKDGVTFTVNEIFNFNYLNSFNCMRSPQEAIGHVGCKHAVEFVILESFCGLSKIHHCFPCITYPKLILPVFSLRKNESYDIQAQ